MVDEPSLGLARLMVREVFKAVDWVNSKAVMDFLVGQEVKYILPTADRAYVLENGRISMEGKGQGLLNNEHVKKVYLGIYTTHDRNS
jgi:branched-chain amino acid transport system ATP-binding protein